MCIMHELYYISRLMPLTTEFLGYPLPSWSYFLEHKIAFDIKPQCWDGSCNWKPTSCKTRTRLSDRANIMDVDACQCINSPGTDVVPVSWHGPLNRNVELRFAHAPGMPEMFTPPPVTHVSWCMPGSLTSGFRWSQWRGKRSRHSRYMRNP